LIQNKKEKRKLKSEKKKEEQKNENIHNVGVASNPANVCDTSKDVSFVIIEGVFEAHCGHEKVSRLSVLHSFRHSRAAVPKRKK
jgi:hypothetical protein